MAKKRTVKRKSSAPARKRKKASVARTGKKVIDVGKVAASLAKRMAELRVELKKLKRVLIKNRKKRL